MQRAGYLWPARAFYAARDAFWQFSNDSPVFESARPASEHVPFKRTYRRLEIICLQPTILFAENKM